MMKLALGLFVSASMLMAQTKDMPDAHVATAKAAAGQDYVNLFNTTCGTPQTPARGQAPQGGGQRQGPAQRFSDIVRQAGADVIISNHTQYDGSRIKQPLLATRKAGDPNPYVVGNDSVRRYLKVAEECATAGLLRLN